MRDAVTLACTECKQRNYQTNKNKKHTTERLEMKKVVWPTKNELVRYTIVVLITVAFISLLIMAVDFVFTGFYKLFAGALAGAM